MSSLRNELIVILKLVMCLVVGFALLGTLEYCYEEYIADGSGS